MNRFQMRIALWPWLVVTACWLTAFILLCRIDTATAMSSHARAEASITDLLFSSSRVALGNDFYRRADVYFHKGIEYSRPPARRGDPFRRLVDAVAPEGHLHTTGDAAKEIMPWLRLATRMDPHNVEAYLVMAFWLATGVDRPDLALQVLTEAQNNNPGNYRVLLEKGRLMLRNQDFARAGQALDLALKQWPGPGADADETQARLDRAVILTLRALLHEHAGEFGVAASMLAEVLAIFPDRVQINQRITELRAGRPCLQKASSLMSTMVNQKPAHMRVESAQTHAQDAHAGHDHGPEDDHDDDPH